MSIMANLNHHLPADESRKRLIKIQVKTNPYYGKNPPERTLDELFDAGVFFLDKPSGPTCHQIDAWIKSILHHSKVGHAGTLDPNVTGVLPIGIGKAARGLHVLSQSGKEYVAIMKLHKQFTEKKIKDTLQEFVGTVNQIPPVRSAVKRVQRKRRIYYIDFLEMSGNDVLFRVGCQAGTYIRTLCVDIGKKLGCNAHLTTLRRTRVGNITEFDLCTLHDIKDGYTFLLEDKNKKSLQDILSPIEAIFTSLPHIVVRDSAVDALCHGADLAIPGVAEIDEGIQINNSVAIMTLKNEIIAFGKSISSTEDIIEKDHGVCVVIDQVYMKKGTYPSIWKKH
jgi:H/ACA ribonucleoprotein complex subunit 4